MEKEKKETWEEIGKKLYEEWANRAPFRFSPENDPAYTAQRDVLRENGSRAMRDTVARASAATGGYGNSYAVTAGEAAYKKGTEGLAEIIPSLYELAFDRYRAEGEALYDRMQAVKGFADKESAAQKESEQAAQKEKEEQEREEAFNAGIVMNPYWPKGIDPADVEVPNGLWHGVSTEQAYAVLLKAGAAQSVLEKLIRGGDWTRKKTFGHEDVKKYPEIYAFDTYEKYLEAYVNAALARLR